MVLRYGSRIGVRDDKVVTIRLPCESRDPDGGSSSLEPHHRTPAFAGVTAFSIRATRFAHAAALSSTTRSATVSKRSRAAMTPSSSKTWAKPVWSKKSRSWRPEPQHPARRPGLGARPPVRSRRLRANHAGRPARRRWAASACRPVVPIRSWLR